MLTKANFWYRGLQGLADSSTRESRSLGLLWRSNLDRMIGGMVWMKWVTKGVAHLSGNATQGGPCGRNYPLRPVEQRTGQWGNRSGRYTNM
jgi:hypothetical protein